MDVAIDRLKQLLCDGGKIVSYKGLNESFGHLSARIVGQQKFLITTRGALAFVEPSEIEEVDFEGRKLTENSPQGAPNEVFLHAEVYKARPEIMAIARTQSFWCEVFGIRMEPVKPVHVFGAMLLGETALFDEPMLGDVAHIGKQMVEKLGDKNAILLRGNGNVVLGRSVEEAVVKAVFLDDTARLQYRARTLGATGVRYFSGYEAETQGTAHLRPDRIQRAWGNYLRLANHWLRITPAPSIRQDGKKPASRRPRPKREKR